MNFDWSDLAFGSKKPINSLKAAFIAAPRAISPARFAQLVKEYLPKGNIVLGLAKEDYILGFEDQPQFCTLKIKTVQEIIGKVNKSSAKNKIYTLSYFQRELNYLLEKLDFRQAIFVNGSWKHSFHTLPQYYAITRRAIPFKLISPFASEAEAKSYEKHITKQLPPVQGASLERSLESEEGMFALAKRASEQSFDYCFQTGLALGRKQGGKYELLALTFNKVVPYQTYAMHFGASREANFSPPHDLNYYDTNHAEVELLIKAQQEKIDLRGTTLFINLLPCPSCARMLSQTGIAEFIYQQDHSEGYAIKMLEMAGKKVRRVVA